MRLWHIDLIPYLPKSQLVAQWRELNSIFKKQDKHILINYVYNYPVEYLCRYTATVVEEMVDNRNMKIKKWDNYDEYFKDIDVYYAGLKFEEHDNEYLTICYYNLKEKFMRGQKDFSKEEYEALSEFVLMQQSQEFVKFRWEE